MHPSLNVRDHVSQPYSTTGNIIVLYDFFLIVNPNLWKLLRNDDDDDDDYETEITATSQRNN